MVPDKPQKIVDGIEPLAVQLIPIAAGAFERAFGHPIGQRQAGFTDGNGQISCFTKWGEMNYIATIFKLDKPW